LLTFPRSCFRRLHALCRRGRLLKRRTDGDCIVTLIGASDGCRVRAAAVDIAIEYYVPGSVPAETIHLPLEAWGACAGTDDGLVTIEAEEHGQVRLSPA
jgi:hypothetical protein